MEAQNPNCSVCGVRFELHFRYQLEEGGPAGAEGSSVPPTYYCTQRCLEASHRSRSDGQVACEACARRFSVELAAQVLFTGGRRRYACTPECRKRVLEGIRAVRLGQLMDPNYPIEETSSQGDELTPTPGEIAPLSFNQTPEPPRVSTIAPTPGVSPGTVQPLHGPKAAAEARRNGTPQVLAVFNHKGGTGKTTTAVHVAAGLAGRGKKVLLLDTDGQGNVATSLGIKFERSLYHVLVMGLDYREVMLSARPSLDLLPANETVAAAELFLAGQRQRDRVLATRFAAAKAHYDHIIVDCSPSLSLMNQNALVMADAVLCPVACDYLSLVGIQKVVRTIKQINRHLSHPLTFWGVLPTFFDTRAKICNEALETLRGYFRDVCLEPIRMASRVKEAPSQGKTLFEYAPTSSAALDYHRVVERLLGEEATTDSDAESLEGVA